MKRSTIFKLHNAIALEVGWFVAVFGAAWGYAWPGPLVVALLAGVHVYILRHKRVVPLFLLLVGLAGFLIDTALGYAGVFTYPPPAAFTWICPLWLTALWVNLATTMDGCLAWLQDRPWLAAGLGAIAGPAAYYSGVLIGALEFSTSTATALAVLAVVWAVVLPGMFLLRARLNCLEQVR